MKYLSTLRIRGGHLREDGAARGNYSPVSYPNPGAAKRRVPIFRTIKQLAPMVALLLGGACLMLVHHLLNAYLDEKRIDPGAKELPTFLMSQRNVNFIGNTIAHGARIVLAMAISATFHQVFWETLRSRSHAISQIDALVNCGHSPFQPSAFRAARASPVLYAISIAVSATALVVVFTPGSLSVSTDFQRKRTCVVPTVPVGVMEAGYSTASSLNNVAYFLTSSRSYLPAFQDDLSTTCGEGFSSCSYNLSFLGPAVDCVDVTNQTDFSSLLTPLPISPSANDTIIWTTNPAVYSELEPLNGPITVTFKSGDMWKNSLQAINCSAYNASYDVTVSLHENTAALVQVWNVKRGAVPLRYDDNSFLRSYSTLGMNAMLGECDTISQIGTWGCSPFVQALLATTANGELTFSDPIADSVKSFMQNMTISLLSGNVGYGISNDTATNLQYVNSTCSSQITAYLYNPNRLISAYGIALAVTIFFVVYGCWLTIRNGVERALLMSKLAGMALNDNLIAINETVSRYRVQIRRTKSGHQSLIMVPNLVTTLDNSQGSSKLADALPQGITEIANPHAGSWKVFAVAYWKTAILLILGSTCTMILNHLFYHRLNGKAPSSPFHMSVLLEWSLNQTVINDIGNAITYAGQTFLAVAIAKGCSQIFWYSLRRQGQSISRLDSIMSTQAGPFSSSIFSALRGSISVPLLALLAASTPLVSIFASSSIKIAPAFKKSEECTVQAPRNLSALVVNASLYNITDGNFDALSDVVTSGTYLPPILTCETSPSTSQCAFDVSFMGPGLECEEIMTSSNYSSFISPRLWPVPNVTSQVLFQVNISTQTEDDLRLQLLAQDWDVKRSVYQAVTCTGVIRSYSVTVFQTPTDDAPVMNVTESRIVSTVYANISRLTSFAEYYVYNMMEALVSSSTNVLPNGEKTGQGDSFPFVGGIGNVELDGSISWDQDLARALEEYAQNGTLSIFSGQVFTFNADFPNILQNVTATCTNTLTAYDYSSRRLFLAYGLGIFITILCVIWGWIAVTRNGVEESMDFSRLLRAILNERMYNAKDVLDGDTVIRADDTPEGALAPINLYTK